MKQPHVAIICPACGGSGSVASVAIHHAKELARYFRVTLLSDTFPEQKLENVIYSKVSPLRFDFLRRFSHVPNECSFALSIQKKLSLIHHEDTLQIIMCHGHVAACLAAIKLKNRYGIPYILVSHGYIFDRPKGTYDMLLTALYRAATPPAHRNAEATVALSPYMRLCALKAGSPVNSIHLIPNGIDTADIGLKGEKTLNFNETAKKLKILYVGWFVKPKGIDVLLNACKILQTNKIKFNLKLIGSGPLEEDIREFVFHSGLSEQVHFLGQIDRKLLGYHYQNSDIVCVPSNIDALPTVVLEALVSGTPVIASDTGGIPFMVKQGENGILFTVGDENALANIIIKLYHDSALLSRLAKQAKPSIWPEFSWTSTGKKMRKMIDEILR